LSPFAVSEIWLEKGSRETNQSTKGMSCGRSRFSNNLQDCRKEVTII
jgi:hypothetical protein